jgi:hypothetical protein
MRSPERRGGGVFPVHDGNRTAVGSAAHDGYAALLRRPHRSRWAPPEVHLAVVDVEFLGEKMWEKLVVC